MKFDLVKHKDGYFVPAADSDMKKAQKIGIGEVVKCKSVDQRNIKFHRQYFAMVRFAFHHLPERFTFTDEEDLREALLIAIGWKSIRHDFHGNTKEVAKSISFEKVGQQRFEKIYSKTLDLVARLVEIDSKEVESELVNFM